MALLLQIALRYNDAGQLTQHTHSGLARSIHR